MIAVTPPPPYWAVIFAAGFSGREAAEYAQTGARMVTLMKDGPGHLVYEAAQSPGGGEVTACYCDSEAGIRPETERRPRPGPEAGPGSLLQRPPYTHSKDGACLRPLICPSRRPRFPARPLAGRSPYWNPRPKHAMARAFLRGGSP
jgi:hypothetical protein